MGIPLYNIKDVRTMYGMDPFGNEPIDFDKYVKFYQSILVTLFKAGICNRKSHASHSQLWCLPNVPFLLIIDVLKWFIPFNPQHHY